MRATPPFDAVVFDMDGVVTDTASLHAAAWRALFDRALADPAVLDAASASHAASASDESEDAHAPAETDPSPFEPDTSPFDLVAEYRAHVDGRPREDGIRTFLASRGIRLPEGADGDPAGAPTVHGLAEAKNDAFARILDDAGLTVFGGTVDLLRRLRAGGVATALVTASRNGRSLLQTAGIIDLFDVILDGQTTRDLGLPGKPEPDTFLEAARRLGVSPVRCAVLEDAIAGVTAASAGGFGHVVGIDRHGDRAGLAAAGADIVVGDVHELDLGERRDRPRALHYRGSDDAHDGKRAALTTTANGYLSVRGTAPEAPTRLRTSPGTYMAGVVNRLTSSVQGRSIEHESMVNLPHWCLFDVRFSDGDWLSAGGLTVVDEEHALDMDDGVLTRTAHLQDHAGRALRIRQRRLVSMDRQHVAALLTRVEAEASTTATVIVRTGIDARALNDNVAEYDQLAKRHLDVRHARVLDDGTVLCEVATTQSRVRIGFAQRTTVTAQRTGPGRRAPRGSGAVQPWNASQPTDPHVEGSAVRGVTDEVVGADGSGADGSGADGSAIFRDHTVDVTPGAAVDVDTITAAVNSRDPALSSVRGGAVQQLDWIPEKGFADLLPGHRAALSRLWDRFGVRVEPRNAGAATGTSAGTQTQLMVDLHTFHLLQAMSHHTTFIDAGTTARGLTGEGYRGHVFWDEVYVLPLLNLRLPEISKALLLYRWRRLDAARHLAREAGFAGARFPWQSGSDGREETPVELWNHRSSRWMPDHSRRQYHVGLAVAFNAWQHYRATADTKWLAEQGGELLIEVVRLFASMAEYDAAEDRYHIRRVMGPDEFHDGCPETTGSGVDDNAYTNIMVAWAARHAVRIFEVLSSHEADELSFRLSIRPDEPAEWAHLAARLFVPFGENGLISQFAGYDDLEELDWEAYRRHYGNIGRMDLILESEDDTTNRYKLSKQADVTMLFFLLSPEGVVKELRRMGYPHSLAQVEETVDYYVARSTDGSSLSRVVNAGVLAMIGRADAWDHWQSALRIDIDDTQWGSTAEGVHLGAMAGTVDVVVRAFAGVVIRYDRIEFRPRLPRQLGEVSFRVLFQGQVVDVRVSHEELVLVSRSHETRSILVRVGGSDHRLEGGARLRFPL